MDRRIICLILLLTIFAINTQTATAATIADWGDVVNVIYSLYLDAAHTTPQPGNVNVDMYATTGKYIYITSGSSVPTDVLGLYPQASAAYLTKFKEGIVGAELNVPKSFKINKENGYTTPGHELYDKDLYFVVTLTQILYDASEHSSSNNAATDSTTTRSRTPLPFEDFNALLAISAGVVLIGGGIIIWNYRTSKTMKFITSEKQMGSSMREEVIKKDKDTIKELRELTETISATEDSASNQTEVKIRRRRK
ncbi:MAG: hypothetical protein ACFFAU_06820 [Candidatus Hodarchaeota archaeon]